MRLSVIIPVHNAEEYLGECLDSVLGQSVHDLEVICVDDASTDASAAVIEDYCKKDSRVRLIKNEKNLYAGSCRNIGIEAAKGEYIHFLDADDKVERSAYERYWELVRLFDPDIIKGRGICFDNGTGELCDTPPLLSLREVAVEDIERPFSFRENPEILSHVSVVPWNGIYRRSLLMDKNIRFNQLVCVNDRSFFNEVTVAADTILITNQPIVRYRINNGASLMGRRARNFSCQFASYEIVKEQCEKYKLSAEAKRIVLDRELADVFLWYRRYRRIPEIQEEIERETEEFAAKLDLAPFGTKRIVLDRELADVFLWYRRYRRIPEIQEEIERETEEFAAKLDLAPFGNRVSKLRWYATYLMVSGKEPFYKKAGRKVKYTLKKFIK